MSVKFRKFYVANETLKARVSYSLDNRIDGKCCVTIYAKDWCRTLGKILRDGYKNESDFMTDYFEQGKVVLYSDSPYYLAARKVAEVLQSEREAKYCKSA